MTSPTPSTKREELEQQVLAILDDGKHEGKVVVTAAKPPTPKKAMRQ